jgi:hypothetical protein
MFKNDAVKQFKNYWEWQHWLQAKYFMENDKTVWTNTEIKKLDPADLNVFWHIQIHLGRKPKIHLRIKLRRKVLLPKRLQNQQGH